MSPAPQFVQISSHPKHLSWHIDRPDRGNGLGISIARALHSAAQDLYRQESRLRSSGIAALVITAEPIVSTEHRLWIAGGDLKELAALQGADEAAAYAQLMSGFARTLAQLSLPVIIAMDGLAIGGGAELALMGDIRLASTATRFDFKQLQVGLPTGYGSTQRLVAMLGLARAQDMLFGCRQVDADEALALGLLSEVCSDHVALKAAIGRWVERFSSLSIEALAAQKAMLWHSSYSHPGSLAASEVQHFKRAWGNPTHKQFLQGFLSRRAKT